MRVRAAIAAVVLIAQAAPGIAQTGCDTKAAQAAPGTSSPAATGTDGTGATDASGGSGANMAGIEHQTRSPPTGQSEEAKGLDLKMETKPPGKC